MHKEKNDEYRMARNQLRTAMTAIKRLMKHVEGEGELKAWVQSKLTKAADYMDSVADYMDSNDKVVKEARELSSDIHTILEAKKPKKRPGFPGGPQAVEQYRKMQRSSVGEMGTDELVNRYKAMTPGQEKDKKTIETIKRVVESRRYGERIPSPRKFPGGYVGLGSSPRKIPSRLGSKPGPVYGPGRKRVKRLHIG